MRDKYPTDIKMGERYRDEQTGFEGVVTSVTFYQYACERVCLEAYDPTRKEIKESVFDAPRLTHIATNVAATAARAGGPGRPNPQRGPAPR
jgi:hypothetical protein